MIATATETDSPRAAASQPRQRLPLLASERGVPFAATRKELARENGLERTNLYLRTRSANLKL